MEELVRRRQPAVCSWRRWHRWRAPAVQASFRDSVVDVLRVEAVRFEWTVRHDGTTHGAFVLVAATSVARLALEQRQVAIALADQVGAALASLPAGAPSDGPA